MGIYQSNGSSDSRISMNLLKNMPKGNILQLYVFDFKDSKQKEIFISKNRYGGGDIEISNHEIEHYEDFEELISFFNHRFSLKKD